MTSRAVCHSERPRTSAARSRSGFTASIAARAARTMRGSAMIVAASTAAYQVKAIVHPVSS